MLGNRPSSTVWSERHGNAGLLLSPKRHPASPATGITALSNGRAVIFTVIDTVGSTRKDCLMKRRRLPGQVREQALFAIEESDLIIHLLDGKEGLITF